MDTGVEITFEGFLEKRAMKSGRNWKKRYFQLQSPYLTYRAAPGKKEKGRLLLTGSTTCSEVQDKKIVGKRSNVVLITLNSKDAKSELLYVSASSVEESKKWKEEIAIASMKLKDIHVSTKPFTHQLAGSLHNIVMPGPPPPAALPGPPSANAPPSLSSTSSTGETKNADDAKQNTTGPPIDPKMWGWGDNVLGQIGQSVSTLQNIASPKHVEALKRKNAPSFAACGTLHTVCVTVKGMLFGFGDGKDGQLGCGDKVDNSSRPYLLASVRKERCVQIAASRSHNVAVMEDGKVLVWGTGKNGSLGLGADLLTIKLPTPIPSLGISAGVSIGRIACGGEHTMFLTRSGAVYCCGKNTLGQLGLGHTKDIFEPTLIRSLVSTPIRDAACGDCFTIVSEMEQTNLQQCGFIGKPNIHLDAETNVCGPGGTFDHDEDGYTKTVIVNLSFENVKLPELYNGKAKILAVSAGAYHCGILVDGDGDNSNGAESVLTWGEGVHGALGHSNEERCELPTIVEALDHCCAIQLSMGHEFSALLTTDDRLYVWGAGRQGQLGNGYYVNASTPVLTNSPGEDIHWCSISCGENHMVGVTGKGPPRYDPDENTFVRERHQKESALPSYNINDGDDTVQASLAKVMTGFSNISNVADTNEIKEADADAGSAPPPPAPPPSSPTPSAPEPDPVVTEEEPTVPTHWSYQDAEGNVQGPFESSMMHAWYTNDMIHWNLGIRDANGPDDAPFQQLIELFPDKDTSFGGPYE